MSPRTGQIPFHNIEILDLALQTLIGGFAADFVARFISCVPLPLFRTCWETLHYYLGNLIAIWFGWTVFLRIMGRVQDHERPSGVQLISNHQLTGALVICIGPALLGNAVCSWVPGKMFGAMAAMWIYFVI